MRFIFYSFIKYVTLKDFLNGRKSTGPKYVISYELWTWVWYICESLTASLNPKSRLGSSFCPHPIERPTSCSLKRPWNCLLMAHIVLMKTTSVQVRSPRHRHQHCWLGRKKTWVEALLVQRGSLQGPVVGETIKTSKVSVLLVVGVLFLLVGNIYVLFFMIWYNIKIDYASLA